MTDRLICPFFPLVVTYAVSSPFLSPVLREINNDHGRFGASTREVRYSSHLGPHFPGACFLGCVSPDEGDSALC